MTSFTIGGKVALVTGGASGLGFHYAVHLLSKGAKGVVLADIQQEVGRDAVQKIESKFGKNKAIFVKTDVTNYEEFENAFKKTVETFKNVDILINNAGILNDATWRKEIEINVNGTIHGMLLGLEKYIPKYKSGHEGLIVNISSIAGIDSFGCLPIYVGTKFAVHGMTLSWGLPSHYERTKVRVVGVCPGVTETALLDGLSDKHLGEPYGKILPIEISQVSGQTPEDIAPHVMTIIEKAPSGTMWVVEGGEEPYQFVLPDRFKMQKVHLK